MANLKVSVEPLGEKRIKEFLPSGGEIFVEPLSQADLLVKNAQKIDFDSLHDLKDTKDKESNEPDADTEKEKEKFRQPWEEAKKHLRSSLQELNVLSDVLCIAQQRHYLLPDPVSQPAIPSQGALQLHLTKANLIAASVILKNGADSVRRAAVAGHTSLSESSSSSGTIEASSVGNGSVTVKQEEGEDESERHQACGSNRSFYTDLLTLCQSWPVRRGSQQITGDLALHPDMAGPLCRYEIERRPFGKSSTRLEVAVATELRSPHCLRIFTSNVAGVSAQQVFSGPYSSTAFSVAQGKDVPSWQRTLETAENSLMCRDMFRRLVRESSGTWCDYRVIRRPNWLLVQLAVDRWLHIVCVTPSARQGSTNLAQIKESDAADDSHRLHLEDNVLSDVYRRYLKSVSAQTQRPAITTIPVSAVFHGNSSKPIKPSELLLQNMIDYTSVTLTCRQLATCLSKWKKTLRGINCIEEWLPSQSLFHASVRITLTTTCLKPTAVSIVHIDVGKDEVKAFNSSGFVHRSRYVDATLSKFLISCVTRHNWKIVHDVMLYWKWRAIGETCSETEYRMIAVATGHTSELRLQLSCDVKQKLSIQECRTVDDQQGLRKTVEDLTAKLPPARTGEQRSLATLLSLTFAHLCNM